MIDLKRSNNELITQELSQIENIQSLIDTTQSLEPKLWLEDPNPKLIHRNMYSSIQNEQF